MAERMATLDPFAMDRYHQRAAALAERMESSIQAWERRLSPVREHPIVIYKKEWEYLAAWIGWEIIGAIEHRPGISPSPRHVENLVQHGRELGGVIVIAAPWDHIDAARNAADKMGAPLLILPAAVGSLSGVDDYPAKFETICVKFEEAMTGSSP
jgi:ABC-type Zn uptake system ZnuABC Zn-binding protein ZnuA